MRDNKLDLIGKVPEREAAGAVRRPYTAPRLQTLGKASELTKGGAASNPDGGGYS